MKPVKELVAEANSKVKTIPPAEAMQLLKNRDSNVVFVDLRDSAELQRDGKIPGAVHADRGMLEFYLDPATPYHKPALAGGKKLVFYCAGGGRSAMAAYRAQALGVENIVHIGGGLKAWKEAGGPVEAVDKT